jgi:hypothetical protein
MGHVARVETLGQCSISSERSPFATQMGREAGRDASSLGALDRELAEQQAIAESWCVESTRELLRGIGFRSLGYQVMHERQAGHLRRCQLRMSTILVVLSSAMALIGTGNLFSVLTNSHPDPTASMVLAIVELSLSFCMTISLAIQSKNKFDENGREHRQMAYEWSCLVSEIQKQFTLRESNLKILLRDSINEYNHLLRTSMDKIPQRIINKYRDETRGKHISQPLIVSTAHIEEVFQRADKKQLDEAVSAARGARDVSHLRPQLGAVGVREPSYQIDHLTAKDVPLVSDRLRVVGEALIERFSAEENPADFDLEMARFENNKLSP